MVPAKFLLVIRRSLGQHPDGRNYAPGDLLGCRCTGLDDGLVEILGHLAARGPVRENTRRTAGVSAGAVQQASSSGSRNVTVKDSPAMSRLGGGPPRPWSPL